MFAYCINNPVNMHDDIGFRPAFDSYEDQEQYYEWKHQQEELYREQDTDRLRGRDAKKREKKNVDKALGKRGTKDRERVSEELHKGKKKSGKGNDDNYGWGDLKNKEFNKINVPSLSTGQRIGVFTIGTGIIVGTIVEDVLIGGVGIADDGVTISGGAGIIYKAFVY